MKPHLLIRGLGAASVLFLSALSWADEPHPQREAELHINRTSIVTGTLERPNPQGIVDDNPPWFHVVVPLVDDTKKTNEETRKARRQEKWHRRYYFKLSQDKDFKTGVIESGPKGWSFWNPMRQLPMGTWYWIYGVAPSTSPDQPVWGKTTYSFVITGAEQTVDKLPPTADEVLAKIHSWKGPIISIAPDSVGKLLPKERYPELAKLMEKSCNKALEKDRKMDHLDFEMSEKDVPERLKSSVTRAFFAVRARKYWVTAERHTSALLRGYLITGKEEFRERGIRRAIELEKARKEVVYRISGSEVKLRDIAIYDSVASFFVDGFYDSIPKDEREGFLDVLKETIVLKSGERDQTDGPGLHEALEHAHYDQHDWQFKVMDLLNSSITLARHDRAYDDWFRYGYELWLYRSPAISRDDGSCREGNGYFGVHENNLVHCPWILYQLTGYNFFDYKPWYRNVAKYMSFAIAAGNPGQAFSDGGNGGSPMYYFGEVLALMEPGNPWYLWRYKSVGRTDPDQFNADLYKGNKAWDLLQIWNRFPEPDLSAVKPPTQMAAEFRDMGISVMHTDMGNAKDNMMVNFISCPFGSSMHLHPCQNAFNVAYGGEPLFWRTGYYNGGGDHNIMSYKASRAHNTILADGFMQGFDVSEYGWLARFVQGERISYCLGDASAAYDGVHRYVQDVPNPKYGVGSPGMTRFRRHVAVLRPHAVVVYDELEAKAPISWTFMLHSLKEMKEAGDATLTAANSHASATAKLFCASDVETNLTDQFAAAATDEEDKRGGINPSNWHWSVTTKNKLAATRFLTVIELAQGAGAKPPEITRSGPRDKPVVRVGGYEIAADLNPERESFLLIRSTDGEAVLSSGQASERVIVDGDERKAGLRGSTLLLEHGKDGKVIFEEKVDELPDVLKYGNVY